MSNPMTVELPGLVVESAPTATEPVLKLTDLENWVSPPPFRLAREPIPNADFEFKPVKGYRSGKSMALVGVAYGVTAEDAEELAWEVLAAVAPQGESMPLRVTTHRGTREMEVWVDGQVLVLPSTANTARFRIPLFAPDGRKLQIPEDVLSTGVPVPSGGITWPLTWPITWATGGTDGELILTNSGSAPASPLLAVTGGTSEGVQIQEIEGGRTLRLEHPIFVGQTAYFDNGTGRVYAEVIENDWSGYLTAEDWFEVPPKSSLRIQFLPLGSITGAPTLTSHTHHSFW